jgi:hypothetical protein
MKTYSYEEYDLNFINLVRSEWSASRPCRFTPGGKAIGTHWVGGCVDPRAGLDAVEKRKFRDSAGNQTQIPQASKP